MCSIAVLVLLCLFSQNMVVWRMPCVGRLTYTSFMSLRPFSNKTISNKITNCSDHKKELLWAHQYLTP